MEEVDTKTYFDAIIDFARCGNAKTKNLSNEKIDYNALCKKAWLVHGEAYNYSPKRLGVNQMNRYVNVLINGSEDEKIAIFSKTYVHDCFFTMLDYMAYIISNNGLYLNDNESKQFYFSLLAARDSLFHDNFLGYHFIDYAKQVKQSFNDLQNNSKCKDIEKLILASHDLKAFVVT